MKATALSNAENLGDITNAEAMELLRVSRSTLDELVRGGRLKAYKLGRGPRSGRRIRRDSIEAFRQGGAA